MDNGLWTMDAGARKQDLIIRLSLRLRRQLNLKHFSNKLISKTYAHLI
jgi:hypothetical protein